MWNLQCFSHRLGHGFLNSCTNMGWLKIKSKYKKIKVLSASPTIWHYHNIHRDEFDFFHLTWKHNDIPFNWIMTSSPTGACWAGVLLTAVTGMPLCGLLTGAGFDTPDAAEPPKICIWKCFDSLQTAILNSNADRHVVNIKYLLDIHLLLWIPYRVLYQHILGKLLY